MSSYNLLRRKVVRDYVQSLVSAAPKWPALLPSVALLPAAQSKVMWQITPPLEFPAHNMYLLLCDMQ